MLITFWIEKKMLLVTVVMFAIRGDLNYYGNSYEQSRAVWSRTVINCVLCYELTGVYSFFPDVFVLLNFEANGACS